MRFVIFLFLLIPGMAQAAMYTDVIDDNETVCLSPSIKTVPGDWKATVVAKGTWGSGTVAWKVKTGSTYVAMKDLTGVAYTSTADDIFGFDLGKASYSGTDLQVCGTMSGATTPSVTIELYDNN